MSKLKVFSAMGLICAYVLVGHQALADESKKAAPQSTGAFFLKNSNTPGDAGAGEWPTVDGLKTSAEVIESRKGVRYTAPRAYQILSPESQPAARIYSKPLTFTQSTTTPARRINGITSPLTAGKGQTSSPELAASKPQAAYNPKELSAGKSVPWIRVAQPHSN